MERALGCDGTAAQPEKCFAPSHSTEGASEPPVTHATASGPAPYPGGPGAQPGNG